MRRKDRAVTDFEEILKIIRSCDVCRLAFSDGDYPYVVPLNFGLHVEGEQAELYFHSANAGTKLDLIRKNPKATFEMDCNHNFILYDERMSCTMGYESVIGHGTIEFVEDEKKYEALKVLMHQYHSDDFVFSTKLMPVTTVFKLVITDMIGKRRDNNHPGEKGRKLDTNRL